MRAIVFDTDKMMLDNFVDQCSKMENLELVGSFTVFMDAYDYLHKSPVDILFLEFDAPNMPQVSMVSRLKKLYQNLLIVFVESSGQYIGEANRLGVDYYMVKPMTPDILEIALQKMERIAPWNIQKDIVIKTFGQFTVFHRERPIPIVGKGREIFAYVVANQGQEVSNKELYKLVWEDREDDNIHMKVYYNAIHRLRTCLEQNGISDLLISTSRGQVLNTDICSCDFIDWKKGKNIGSALSENEFLKEYGWAESMRKIIFVENK